MIRFILNLESCLIFTTLTQPVKNLLLYSRWANRSGEIGHDEHCIYFFLFSQDPDRSFGGSRRKGKVSHRQTSYLSKFLHKHKHKKRVNCNILNLRYDISTFLFKERCFWQISGWWGRTESPAVLPNNVYFRIFQTADSEYPSTTNLDYYSHSVLVPLKKWHNNYKCTFRSQNFIVWVTKPFVFSVHWKRTVREFIA